MALSKKKMDDLQSRVRTIAELKTRYKNVKFPKELWRVTAEMVGTEVGFPWWSEGGRVTIERKPVKHMGELPYCDSEVSVKVLLLNAPKVPTRFFPFKVSMVMAKKGLSKKDRFYGGTHDASKDGEDTTSLQTLINTATRHLEAQCGLDLSALPEDKWCKFATFESKIPGNEEKPAMTSTTVVMLPLLWELEGEFGVHGLQQCVEKEIITKVKKEVEEEVEVEVEVEKELPGQEGETDEDRKTEIVKEIRKKIEKKIVETDVVDKAIETTSWGAPVAVTLIECLKRPSAHWELALVTELLSEWTLQAAGDIIAITLQNNRSSALIQQGRKRKRQEHKEALEGSKRVKKEARDEILKARYEEMEEKWREDDEGKTDEELQECKAEREKEKNALTQELQEQWEAEDLAETPEPVDDEEMVEDGAVNEDALAAFSILDKNLETYGACPSEDITSSRLCELLLSSVNTPTSPAAVSGLVKTATNGLMNLKYRPLTDK